MTRAPTLFRAATAKSCSPTSARNCSRSKPSAPGRRTLTTTPAPAPMRAFVLMERKFAPPDDRLRSLIAREKQMPALLAAARVNLQNPPRIFTEIAIEQLPDIISFFQHDVPQAFADANDPALKAEFAQPTPPSSPPSTIISHWLKTDVLPRSNGDFRIGAEPSRKNSNTTRWSICRSTSCSKSAGPICAKIRTTSSRWPPSSSPTKIPRAVLEELGEDHPAPDQLLDAFRATFDRPHRLHPRASHRHHSLRRPAHRRRDAALHARHHHRQHGYPRPIRDPRHRSPTSTSRCPTHP